jgi:hypothetical protein
MTAFQHLLLVERAAREGHGEVPSPDDYRGLPPLLRVLVGEVFALTLPHAEDRAESSPGAVRVPGYEVLPACDSSRYVPAPSTPRPSPPVRGWPQPERAMGP